MRRPSGTRVLGLLEAGARALRALGLGRLVDRVGPALGRAAAQAEVEVDGFRLVGDHVAQLYYLRELEQGRERFLVELIHELTPPHATVVEAGPHVGFVTLHLADAVGADGRVWAFEPNPQVLDVLYENLRRNGLESRVVVVPKALGAVSGPARFFVSGGGETSSLFDAGAAREAVDVSVARLDEVLEEPPELVKLDVEGGEPAVLEGMGRLLTARADAPILLLECNPGLLSAAGRSVAELLSILERAGYGVWEIDEGRHRLRRFDPAELEGEYVNLVCGRGASAAALERLEAADRGSP